MKKKFLLLLICILFFPVLSKAQIRIDTIYYDKDWSVVPHPTFANFYRVALYTSVLDEPEDTTMEQ